MPYSIVLSDGITTLVTVPDRTILGPLESGSPSNSSLNFVGRGAVNFSLATASNFAWLAQNFAATFAPVSPLAGQLWYNTSSPPKLYMYNTSNVWVQINTSDVPFASNAEFIGNVGISGNLVVDGGLEVLGNSTFVSGILVEGNATFVNPVLMENTVTVEGLATFVSPVLMENTITVDGNATFISPVLIGNSITVNGNATFISPVLMENTLTVDGNATFVLNINSGSLNVTGQANINSMIVTGAAAFETQGTFNNGLQVSNGLTVGGTTNIDNYLNVYGPVLINNDATFASPVLFDSIATFVNGIDVSGGTLVTGDFVATGPSIVIGNTASSDIQIGISVLGGGAGSVTTLAGSVNFPGLIGSDGNALISNVAILMQTPILSGFDAPTGGYRFVDSTFDRAGGVLYGGIAMWANTSTSFLSVGPNDNANGSGPNEGLAFATNIDLNGNMYVYNNITAGGTITPSDERLKENIKTIDGALEKVSKLRGVTFNKKSRVLPNNKKFAHEKSNAVIDYIASEDAKTQMGLIAQEVISIAPELVTTNPHDGMLGISYGNISALLINALNELSKKVHNFSERLSSLEKR